MQEAKNPKQQEIKRLWDLCAHLQWDRAQDDELSKSVVRLESLVRLHGVVGELNQQPYCLRCIAEFYFQVRQYGKAQEVGIEALDAFFNVFRQTRSVYDIAWMVTLAELLTKIAIIAGNILSAEAFFSLFNTLADNNVVSNQNLDFWGKTRELLQEKIKRMLLWSSEEERINYFTCDFCGEMYYDVEVRFSPEFLEDKKSCIDCHMKANKKVFPEYYEGRI